MSKPGGSELDVLTDRERPLHRLRNETDKSPTHPRRTPSQPQTGELTHHAGDAHQHCETGQPHDAPDGRAGQLAALLIIVGRTSNAPDNTEV